MGVEDDYIEEEEFEAGEDGFKKEDMGKTPPLSDEMKAQMENARANIGRQIKRKQGRKGKKRMKHDRRG